MSLLHSLSRHWQIFQIHALEVVHFRIRALVWFLVGSINTVVVLLFWWATLEASDPISHPTTLPALTSYYILILSLSTITICHLEEDISYRDIQKGNLYQYLLHPYPYLLIKFQEEIVWRLLGFFWALVTLVILFALGLQLTLTTKPEMLLFSLVSIVLGMLCSFFVKTSLGLLSIWFTNIRGLTDSYAILEIILAGFIIPLSLLPEWLQKIALASPFATYIYYPIQILTDGASLSQIGPILLIQFTWIIIFFLIARLLLYRGIRHYTGVSQ